ncbi:YbfB/YjiJ family MFS transporter [Acidiphilium acidophilum]|uniref:YbfB/YjiJ family MFS transporter n=1 Tax=Acidiphilium acidophilum TaxID=76588 RepID=UPI002E8E6FC6|nr:YbfB/YjiJ family MFS transporter [Acidiphilium acidophilum]
MTTAHPTASTAAAARVMAAGVASMVLTLGLARFLYTPLLPLMQSQAHLSVAGGGWLATINYAGYMTGTLLAASVGDLAAKFRLYRALLIVALIGTAGMGLTTSMIVWAMLRFAAGVSAVAGLLLSSGLVMNWLRQHGRRLELGIHFGGVGLGIAVSGMLAIAMAGSLNWADQWIIAGAAGLLLLIPAWLWMPPPTPIAGQRATMPDHPPTRLWLTLFNIAYFCAGVGYVVSATFIVAIAAHNPALHGDGNFIWVAVGLGAIPACPLWDRIARRTGDKPALLAAFALLLLSIVLAALTTGPEGIFLGAILYGASFNGITSMTLSIIGRLYPSNPATAMARLTISFGAAQIIAPAASGIIATMTGSYRGALFMAAATMLIGMAVLAALPRPAPIA